MITLDQLLRSRDERAGRQAELLGRFPGKTLLCFTVSLPGAVKRDSRSVRISTAGVDAIRAEFGVPGQCEAEGILFEELGKSRVSGQCKVGGILFEELRDLETGFEGFFVVDVSPLEAKRRCCAIEDTHPLGRLMDIDVILPATPVPERSPAVPEPVEGVEEIIIDGQVVRLSHHPFPLGREVVGLEPRRCLLCDRPARECVRSRTHQTADLINKIDELLNNT